MVLQICMACGAQLPLRVRFCSCGHVMLENVTMSNKRRQRNSADKRIRRVPTSLQSQNSNAKIIEARDFYLHQAQQLKKAEKLRHTTTPLPRPQVSAAERQKIKAEEARKKLEEMLSSPVYKKRMQKALRLINQKLLKQNRFIKLLSYCEEESNCHLESRRNHLRKKGYHFKRKKLYLEQNGCHFKQKNYHLEQKAYHFRQKNRHFEQNRYHLEKKSQYIEQKTHHFEQNIYHLEKKSHRLEQNGHRPEQNVCHLEQNSYQGEPKSCHLEQKAYHFRQKSRRVKQNNCDIEFPPCRVVIESLQNTTI